MCQKFGLSVLQEHARNVIHLILLMSFLSAHVVIDQKRQGRKLASTYDCKQCRYPKYLFYEDELVKCVLFFVQHLMKNET